MDCIGIIIQKQRMLPEGRIKHDVSGTQLEKKQKDRSLKLGDGGKLSNTGNRDIGAIMQHNCDT